MRDYRLYSYLTYTHSLNVRYALFLDTTARDVKSAEPVYLRAIEAAPADADCLRNFAVFLSEKLKDFARADDYFARAVQAISGAWAQHVPSYTLSQARPDDNEIAWQYWRFLREKLKQPGRAIDLAARAQEHQALLFTLTRQPVRWRFHGAELQRVVFSSYTL